MSKQGVGVPFEAVIDELHRRYTTQIATLTNEAAQLSIAVEQLTNQNEELTAQLSSNHAEAIS